MVNRWLIFLKWPNRLALLCNLGRSRPRADGGLTHFWTASVLARPVQKARSPLDTGAAPGALAGCRVELLQRASRTPSCAKPGWCWAPAARGASTSTRRNCQSSLIVFAVDRSVWGSRILFRKRLIQLRYKNFAAVSALETQRCLRSSSQFRRKRAPLLIFAPKCDAASDCPH